LAFLEQDALHKYKYQGQQLTISWSYSGVSSVRCSNWPWSNLCYLMERQSCVLSTACAEAMLTPGFGKSTFEFLKLLLFLKCSHEPFKPKALLD